MDLLSQYEGEERASIVPPFSSSSSVLTPHSYIAYQPLSLETNTPMDAVYRVMAAHVAEEEQTQRTMITLNDMKPFFPGKLPEEVNMVLNRVSALGEGK